jgi:hypothetical protein
MKLFSFKNIFDQFLVKSLKITDIAIFIAIGIDANSYRCMAEVPEAFSDECDGQGTEAVSRSGT